MSGMAKMVIVLSLICLGAALGLAGVYALTKGPIAEAQRQEKIRAIGEVMPEGVQITNDPLTDVLSTCAPPTGTFRRRPRGVWRTMSFQRAGGGCTYAAQETTSPGWRWRSLRTRVTPAPSS